jgi:membrane-bound lytic murein transglycosylase D
MMQCSYKKLFLCIVAGVTCALSSTVFSQPSLEGIQVYQKNLEHTERRQILAEDIYRYHNANDLWDELRHEFVLPHYESNPLVQEQIQWFMSHQDFLQSSASRAIPYLYYIMQQVHKRHLPAEVALLPIFESAYDPYAYSTAGAAGIWQMMPGTASGYGIKQNWWYDGRRDVIVSTKAALNHLSYLANFFQSNWLLAIAAYDTGQGNVLSAINKNIRDGYSTSYWYLPLAHETRIYVPRLLALATIIAHPEKYPVYFPPVRNAPYLAQVDVGTQIDLKQAATLAGMSLHKLMQLNPGYNRMITDPNGPYKLVVPIENVEQFTENMALQPTYQRTIHWQHYKVRAGDTLLALAKRFRSSAASLKKLNRLTGNHLRPGTNLVLPRYIAVTTQVVQRPTIATGYQNTVVADSIAPSPAATRIVEQIRSLPVRSAPPPQVVSRYLASTNTGENYVIQPGDTIYMPHPGDSIEKIAAHFHLSPQTVISANPLSRTQHLTSDQRLVIPTHLAMAQPLHYKMTGGDTIYMVRAGDTIDSIARKFHTSPPAIRIANLSATNSFKTGENIVIPTHV